METAHSERSRRVYSALQAARLAILCLFMIMAVGVVDFPHPHASLFQLPFLVGWFAYYVFTRWLSRGRIIPTAIWLSFDAFIYLWSAIYLGSAMLIA